MSKAETKIDYKFLIVLMSVLLIGFALWFFVIRNTVPLLVNVDEELILSEDELEDVISQEKDLELVIKKLEDELISIKYQSKKAVDNLNSELKQNKIKFTDYKNKLNNEITNEQNKIDSIINVNNNMSFDEHYIKLSKRYSRR